jgi:hypothetical protein
LASVTSGNKIIMEKIARSVVFIGRFLDFGFDPIYSTDSEFAIV